MAFFRMMTTVLSNWILKVFLVFVVYKLSDYLLWNRYIRFESIDLNLDVAVYKLFMVGAILLEYIYMLLSWKPDASLICTGQMIVMFLLYKLNYNYIFGEVGQLIYERKIEAYRLLIMEMLIVSFIYQLFSYIDPNNHTTDHINYRIHNHIHNLNHNLNGDPNNHNNN